MTVIFSVPYIIAEQQQQQRKKQFRFFQILEFILKAISKSMHWVNSLKERLSLTLRGLTSNGKDDL